MATTIEQALLKNVNSTLKETVAPSIQIYMATSAKLYKGPFFALQAMEDTRIDVSECTLNMVEKGASGGVQPIETDVIVPKGMTIYGNFSTVEIQSGLLVGYAVSGSELDVEA
jgi:hypothetical protein